MRVAVVHNRYQQPGGEDRVFESEASLLEQAEHKVLRFEVHNDAVGSMRALELAARSVWNPASERTLRRLLLEFRPDVVHVHNTLPILSPSTFTAARRAGAAVVQTLHNYRMICPSATLYRDGRPCELCVSHALQLPSVRHACYRGSRPATAVVAAGTALHRMLGTYTRNVDRFITLTEFARQKLIEGGVPARQLVVKPNFAETPEAVRADVGPTALFVGRLSEEKGVRTLVDAWTRHSDLPPLRIVGDGPLRPLVAALATSNNKVSVLGALRHDAVVAEMCAAGLLVFPSLSFETFGLTIVEAFSVGLPIVASRLGSAAEIVEDGQTGLHFEPGSADALAASVKRLMSDRPLNLAMGERALQAYRMRYTPEANLDLLLKFYADAIRSHRTSSTR